MIKKQLKLQQAGITLIALVVTIIILLILAGVTITLVIGQNGLIGRAQSAYDTQVRATIEQEIEQARGVAEIDRQTKNANYLSTIAEYLNNDDILKNIGETKAKVFSKSGESYVVLTVGELYNFKITESKTEWLENSESAADLLRPETVDLADGDIRFSYSPSTPTQGNVTVTITEKEGLNKNGNTLRYKLGTDGNWTDYTAPFQVSDNVIIYTALYNGKDYGATSPNVGEVSNIDRDAPTSCTFTIDETTEDSITVTATASDTTGIKYFDFSSDGGTTYPEENRITLVEPTAGESNTTFQFTGLSEGTEYTIKVKAIDEAGNSLESSVQQETTESAEAVIIKNDGSNTNFLDKNGHSINVSEIKNYYGHEVIYNGNTYQLFYVDSTGKFNGGKAGVWLLTKNYAVYSYRPYEHLDTTQISTSGSVFYRVNPNLNSKYGSNLRSREKYNGTSQGRGVFV